MTLQDKILAVLDQSMDTKTMVDKVLSEPGMSSVSRQQVRAAVLPLMSSRKIILTTDRRLSRAKMAMAVAAV